VIPVSTHLITVERGADPSTVDPWEAAPPGQPDLVAEHVRAVIAVGAGRGAGVETGTSEAVEFALLCDPVDLSHLDTVIDEATGDRYAVEWVVASPGLAGLASVRAGLSTYNGFGQDGGTA
jgi:hypothetical protein